MIQSKYRIMKKELFLLAAVPQNHIEMEILRLKKDLFYSTGIISAWALTPMVPVAESDTEINLEKLEISGFPSSGIVFDRLNTIEDRLSIGWEQDYGFFSGVAIQVGAFKPESSVLGSCEGLQMADLNEDKADALIPILRSRIDAFSDNLKKWKSCRLYSLKLTVDQQRWWEDVEVEYLDERYIKPFSRR